MNGEREQKEGWGSQYRRLGWPKMGGVARGERGSGLGS